ncbi:hypothetical protein CIRG_08732 [Coccidioides immitis RMSCC 2394]|uniref:Uncharacterized protein n=1 Tax=Coccidioides immitis RMSCC 2394 TaxID=404692 RepID=A0A0J6YK89_COCIT|nr:hypothetical protein CIRG_08732 [Coccidioides immitis RMSCC 2394]
MDDNELSGRDGQSKMEVTKSSFSQALPRILNDIAESCCVALDLEFSGIFSKQDRKPSTDGSSGGGRTLQSRYEEVKEAAEKYQILQVGNLYTSSV